MKNKIYKYLIVILLLSSPVFPQTITPGEPSPASGSAYTSTDVNVPFTITPALYGDYLFMVDNIVVHSESINRTTFSYIYPNITTGTHTLSVKRRYSNYTASISYTVNRKWRAVETRYDNIGNIISQRIDIVQGANQSTSGVYYHYYDYDNHGRLQYVRTGTNSNKNSNPVEATYEYNNSDQVSKQTFPSSKDVSYFYNQRGWINEILESSSTPLFKEDLLYFNNGNVQQQTINNRGGSSWDSYTYTYTYDDINRLTNSSCAENTSYSEDYAYDKDGNFVMKSRIGHSINSYVYASGSDKLDHIIFNGATKSFAYDKMGNLNYDGLKNINISGYDQRNLPLTMTTGDATFKYSYDEMGNRITKESNGTKEYYLRDQTGKELAVYTTGTDNINMINFYGNGLIGKYDIINSAKYYYIKDHLGSIRVTVDVSGQSVSAQDYYPYGEILRSVTTLGSLNDKYKFTGKQRDVETNYDYFGARYYDSEIGRWLQVDPWAKKYPGWSPYNYVFDNPLRLTDPKGFGPWDFITALTTAISNIKVNTANYVKDLLGTDDQSQKLSTAKTESQVKLEKIANNGLSNQQQNQVALKTVELSTSLAIKSTGKAASIGLSVVGGFTSGIKPLLTMGITSTLNAFANDSYCNNVNQNSNFTGTYITGITSALSIIFNSTLVNTATSGVGVVTSFTSFDLKSEAALWDSIKNMTP